MSYRITTRRPGASTGESFKLANISNWDFFNGAVVALHFGANSSQRITGSGVLVAPGVALTARHVIEPELDQILAGALESYARASRHLV